MFGWVWSKLGVTGLVTGLWNWLYSRMNRWNELIFCEPAQIQERKSYFSNFWVGLVKNWHGHSAVLKNEFMDWFNFVHADCDAIFLVRTTSYSRSLTFKRQSAAVALVGPPAVAGMVLWNRVCQSFCPVVCPSVFLELDH